MKLLMKSYLSGEGHASCDQRGRVEWTVKRILDPMLNSNHDPQPTIGLVSFKMAFQHDSLDRTILLTYPDLIELPRPGKPKHL
jgi:hypothetical protein